LSLQSLTALLYRQKRLAALTTPTGWPYSHHQLKNMSNPMTHLFKTCLRTLICATLLWLCAYGTASAQGCDPDVTPPTAVCNADIFVSLNSLGQANLSVAQVDAGSYDNCCLGTIQIRRQVDGPCDADTQPDDFGDNITFCCADLGTSIVVEMRVSDCVGNSNLCWTQIFVEDKTKPILQAPANVSVSCENFDPSLFAYGTPTVTDNCCIDTVITTVNYSQFDTVCNRGTITRTFMAVDCAGNTSTLGVVSAVQKIVVNYEQHYFVRFPNDVFTTTADPNGNYGQPTFFGEDCELIGSSFSDQVFPGTNSIVVEREWTIINWCTYNPNNDVLTVPNPTPNIIPNHPSNLPGPVVSAANTAAPWAPSIVKVNPSDSLPTNYSNFWQADVNGYRYTQYITIGDTFFTLLKGKVYHDLDNNCAYTAGDVPFAGWKVRATGSTTGLQYETTTNASGEYTLACSTTDPLVNLSLASQINYAPNCTNVFAITTAAGQEVTTNLPVGLPAGSNLLTVDLGGAFLRRCFNNNYYIAQGCNVGASTVEDAQIEITLDEYLSYVGSSIPGTLVGNNKYLFELGDLAPGECRDVSVQLEVLCSAPLGATHCTSARILPEPAATWTGPEIQLSSYCDGDSIRFDISNVGQGNMNQSAEFIVVEDVIMRGMSPYQLNAGQTQQYTAPANGNTWRVETEQVNGHPYQGLISTTQEGCGGLNTPGLVTIFPISSLSPYTARSCVENIGSFDPNDKSAVPVGFGNQHLVIANTDLEYLIRFQNTGTDTAFNIVVLDTLSAHLDATTVRPGVSSHDYTFSILSGNVLRFAFNNILLPDSNINEAASHGFLKFRISQKPDLSNGTTLENSAAIYFDFNEPIITNTVLHTIGDHFLEVSTEEQYAQNPLRVTPNPARDAAIFAFEKPIAQATFVLVDATGKNVRVENINGLQYRFERQQLPDGVYFYRIQHAQGLMYTGKIVLK
jgi:uncharacterized repeat protein (TIGR01451 family)